MSQSLAKIWTHLIFSTKERYPFLSDETIRHDMHSRRLINRLSRRIGGAAKIKQAEALTKRWSGAGIFLSRWLITALGPWVNVASGIAAYPWRRFLFWDVLGEVLWVILYVGIGYAFSNRVQAIAEILGNLAWVIVGLIVTVILGWQLVRYIRPEREPTPG